MSDSTVIKKPIQICEFSYFMEMSCGSKNDCWRYRGLALNHPEYNSGYICPSPPVEFDEERCLLRTKSGNLYEIIGFFGKKEEVVNQIKKDIANGGFEYH